MKIELDITPEQADKIKKMLAEDRKMWIEEGKKYYWLGSTSIETGGWCNNYFDIELSKKSNVYRTKEAAEQAERQHLALGTIHKYVRENGIKMAGFNGYVPRWIDGESKWIIDGWDFEEEDPSSSPYWTSDISVHGLIFEEKDDMQKVIENCERALEDLLKINYSIIR